MVSKNGVSCVIKQYGYFILKDKSEFRKLELLCIHIIVLLPKIQLLACSFNISTVNLSFVSLS